MMYYYVYILESFSFSDKNYIGYTTDLKKRLSKHNEGSLPYTSKYKPWKIRIAISFSNKEKALAFEKYLKSHSGKAFISKHF